MYYYYYHHHHHRLKLCCHSVAVILTSVQTKQIRINIHKRNNTKITVQAIKNTVNTSTHDQNTHAYTHPHITQQVTTTTIQDTHQIM
jgi:hypothetical protein